MLDPPKSSISGTPTFLLFYGLALQRDYSLHLLTFPQHVEIAKPENWRKTCSTSAISLFYHTQFYPFDLTSLTLDPPVCVQAAAGLASSLCTVLSAAFGPVKEETEYFSPWDLEGRETSDVALISERKFFSLKGASQTSVTLRGTIRATLDASTLHYSVNHRERGVAYAYMELAINTIKENARGLSLLDANSLSPSARAVHCVRPPPPAVFH